MRNARLAVFIISTGMTLCSPAGGQTPDGPVFNITVEQRGSSDGETMVKNVKAGYWPCAIWNSGYFGGESFSDKSVMGAQTTATPEGLLARRGSIAGMKPGEVLLFYVREKSGTGNEGHCSATLSTIGDGVFSCTVVSGNDKGTYTAGGPVTEPGHEGLPYAPGECGCNSTKTMKPGPEIFAKLQADMQNLNNCVGDFQNGPLTSYAKTIEEWKTLTGELTSALGKDQKTIETAFHDVIPRMESLLQQTQSFDIAGKEFIKDFEKCPALSSSWMDLLKSAVTVTVDSIKTKY